MDLVRPDTLRAYELIRDRITTLELKPGAPVNEQALATELGLALIAVQEALKLLVHDELIIIERGGLFISPVNLTDLGQLSELRLLLETFCARQAAERAQPDDIIILEALCKEQSTIAPDDSLHLFEIDHKFHQAIASAAGNKYLATTLDRFFGLSQRLWFLILPHLEFLPNAVEKHVELVEAIKNGDGDTAADMMHHHVKDFYDKVHEILNKVEK
jgi:DNA-binding GntR family transcriptional regulator